MDARYEWAIRIVVIVHVIQSSMLAAKIFHTVRYGSHKTLRRSNSTPAPFIFKSESLLPLSTWITLTAKVGLDGVVVEADVDRCRNLLDTIAL